MPAGPSRLRADDGATTVEFVAMLPVVVVLALAAWQVLVAAQAAWLSGGAATAAARAQAIGADPRVAAKRRLPGPLQRGFRVRTKDGEVTVRVAVPVVVGRGSLGSFTSRAHLRDQS